MLVLEVLEEGNGVKGGFSVRGVSVRSRFKRDIRA